MLHLSPKAMIVLGVLMMTVCGVIVPLLMVIHALESTFFLIFTSYAISVAGLYLGIIGVAQYVQTKRKR
jgi:hypothetical protein